MVDVLSRFRRLRPVAIIGALLLFGAACSECDPEVEDDEIAFDDVQRAHIDSGVDFPAFEVDTERLEEARREFYEEVDRERVDEVTDADVDRLKASFQILNEAQFLGDEVPPDADVHEASTQYRHQIRTLITPVGKRGFILLGEPLFEECNRGLEELLGAVRDGELSLVEAIEEPPADQFEAYRKNCGNLLAYLKQRHLIDEQGHWTRDDAPELVDIRQRLRWVDEARGQYYPVQKLMSPYELEVFYRWRVEDGEAYSLEARRRYLRTARTLMPDFYGPLAEARLDAEEMDADEVTARFETLADDHPAPEADELDGKAPKGAVYRAIYESMVE